MTSIAVMPAGTECVVVAVEVDNNNGLEPPVIMSAFRLLSFQFDPGVRDRVVSILAVDSTYDVLTNQKLCRGTWCDLSSHHDNRELLMTRETFV
jgi:hypothetical protein